MLNLLVEYFYTACRDILLLLYGWARPAIKGLLRRTTRLCELQRICYGTNAGASRSNNVEYSLYNTRHPELKKCVETMDMKAKENNVDNDVILFGLYAVIRIKDINIKLHNRFKGQLETSLWSIWGYQQLLGQVTAMRKVQVAWPEHGPFLRKLWGLLMPETELQSDISPQWKDIGFQGTDPCTDFRGMGLLSLANLLYFAEEHTSAAQHVLLRSLHPKYGYSFAIVGINITALVFKLFEQGALKNHFYNIAVKEIIPDSVRGRTCPATLRQLQQIYCYAVFEFDALWRCEKPESIMSFNAIMAKFEGRVRASLSQSDVVLRTDFVLQNV